MARLTILQASQQGFGSTLTIHRHIKDGDLPIYEEGGAKLLEVDDLITLFGEPGNRVSNDRTIASAVGQIDIYEYDRMKSELDQKNKKNMWLAADLAEVVRELKEKEIKFEAERDRLLKILEQAQALLLREAKRAGAGLKRADGSTPMSNRFATDGHAAGLTESQPPTNLETVLIDSDAGPLTIPSERELFQGEISTSLEEMPTFKGDGSAASPSVEATSPNAQTDTSETAPETLPNPKGSQPTIIVKDENRPKKRPKSRIGANPVNPLIPPLEDETDTPRKSRLFGTMTWILLSALVGCGAVFFKFQPQIMSSVAEITKVLGRP
ncbi:MAG: hypothetical protein O3C34_17770 [Proteobacteria bacterium]|nr:hypothetical protein [Pseudomonadota bacterium]